MPAADNANASLGLRSIMVQNVCRFSQPNTLIDPLKSLHCDREHSEEEVQHTPTEMSHRLFQIHYCFT